MEWNIQNVQETLKWFEGLEGWTNPHAPAPGTEEEEVEELWASDDSGESIDTIDEFVDLASSAFADHGNGAQITNWQIFASVIETDVLGIGTAFLNSAWLPEMSKAALADPEKFVEFFDTFFVTVNSLAPQTDDGLVGFFQSSTLDANNPSETNIAVSESIGQVINFVSDLRGPTYDAFSQSPLEHQSTPISDEAQYWTDSLTAYITFFAEDITGAIADGEADPTAMTNYLDRLNDLIITNGFLERVIDGTATNFGEQVFFSVIKGFSEDAIIDNPVA